MSLEGTITLNDKKYIIEGEVHVRGDSRYAQKLVTGDYTKDSDKRRSSHTWSDFSGGMLLKNMRENTEDIYRSYFNTCNSEHPNNLVLGPLNTEGSSTGFSNTGTPGKLFELSGILYCDFGFALGAWSEGYNAWITASTTLYQPIKDVVVIGEYAYIAGYGDVRQFSASGWAFLSSGTTVDATHLVEWDNKLYAIGEDGQLERTSNLGSEWAGAEWEDDALLNLPRGSVTGMIVYIDSYGNDIIYVGTKYGLYAHDAATERFVRTGFYFPKHDNGCMGMCRHRDALYVSVGSDVYEYKITGGSATLTPIGLQYGASLPINYIGSITHLCSSYNHLYAIVDCTTTTAQALYIGDVFQSTVSPGKTGYSYVAKWGNNGWSVVKISGATDSPAKYAATIVEQGNYRLWFTMNQKTYYQELENDLVNPLRVGNYKHESSGELVTPWFDADNDTASKTALRIIALTTGCSANETVTITYQINNAAYTDSWTSLSAITTSTKTNQAFGSSKGIEFYNIRFKVALARGSTNTNTPNLHFLTLEYVKVPDGKHDYQILINMPKSQSEHGTTVTDLSTAYTSKTLVNFKYDTVTEATPKYVIVESFDAEEKASEHRDGIYQVTLIEG